jgi:membrane-bound lytic murein transglycosylase D
VKSGDSLYTIAQKFDLDVDDLREFNNLKGNHLAINQTLKLTGTSAPLLPQTSRAEPQRTQAPAVAAATASAPAKATPSAASPAAVPVKVAAPAAKANIRTYTVKAGDTLYSIAQRFSVPLDDLLRWNNLNSKSVIQPGRQIKVSA